MVIRKCNSGFSRSSVQFHYPSIYIFIITCILVANIQHSQEEDICTNIDIRNKISRFSKLENCTVIEGYLQILLIDNGVAQDYENLSFPNLREVTGYLLFYRAFGLPSLEKLFPNLAVIRGSVLFHNYALVIYEMFQLQEIGLKSLTDILRGSVRIEKNPNLCYLETIDWDLIAKAGAGGHFFKDNRPEKRCPNTCSGNESCRSNNRDVSPRGHLCWNSQACQKICAPNCVQQNKSCMLNDLNKCCHLECLGGCTGTGATDCVACKHVIYKGRCQKQCPLNTFEYLNRRCVDEMECKNMFKNVSRESLGYEFNGNIHWKPFAQKCRPDCPHGYVEADDDPHSCKKCESRCPKVCSGGTISSVGSAQSFKGCTHINGSLDIQIQGGANIITELEENLKDIREIRGYLKIARSFPLVSINFFKELTLIKGEILEMKEYSFLVLENQNLKELWDWQNKPTNLSILQGKIFFHFNSKLCLSKISELKRHTNVSDWDDRDVSPSSNGDRVACDLTEMNITIWGLTYNTAGLCWENFRKELADPRSLLSYVVYYREAPSRNISIFDGHDACGSDIWKVDDVETSNNDEDVYHLLTGLTPYTQYAVYIRTYTTASSQRGAQSQTIYFTTKPDTPTLPVAAQAHPTGHNEIFISWKPPKTANGKISYYVVEGYNTIESPAFFSQRNYCIEPISHLDLNKKVTEESNTHMWITNTTVHESGVLPEQCCPCSTERPVNPEIGKEAEFQIHFEDFLHNTVYIKNPSYNNDKSKRQRRSVLTTIRPTSTTNLVTDENNTENITIKSNSSAAPTVEVPEKFRKLVYSNETYLKIENLRHFTEYTIEIIACQEVNKSDQQRRPPCSSKAITTVRTLKLGNADDIDSSTVHIKRENATSKSIYVKWEEPKHANGLIISYTVEYKKLNVENYKPTQLCITQLDYQQFNGCILNKMQPGNYSIRIQATSLAGSGNWTSFHYFYIPESKAGLSIEIVAVVVAVIIVFVILLVATPVWLFLKKRYRANQSGAILYTSVNPEYMSAGLVYEPDEWEVPREKIALLKELGQGSFGMVYEGEARDLEPDKPIIRCAVKTVNENATLRERIEFLQEASVMKAFSCHHVVKLLGVVAKGHPPLVVMELMANGDLKSYLRSHRPDSEDSDSHLPPTLKRIFQMAIEIGDGMAYLAANKFVHRDLAARNCMVADDLTVKIGDFGMTRDIYETDYYRKGGKGLLPVRWMAPESLKDGVFTSQSDVWSYGVVLWEMATLASQPYQGLSNEQVLKYVLDNRIMEKPENCPHRLYDLMKLCWAKNPKARPTFTELVETLLPEANSRFREVSFYYTQRQHMNNQETEVDLDAVTPSTPLKSQTTWNETSLSLASDEEAEVRYFPSVTLVNTKETKSPQQCKTDKDCGNRTDNSSEEDNRRLSIHSNEGSKGLSLPSSDDSKGSKISSLSNGSLANGHIPYPAGRTTC